VTEDKVRNVATAKEYLVNAKAMGAAMAVLPEIWNSPYATAAFPQYAEVLPDIGDSSCPSSSTSSSLSSSSQLLIDTAKELQMWIVGGSIPERVLLPNDQEKPTEKIYNTCLVVNPDGVIVAKHRKVHLFDIDIPGKITFLESDTLSPGNAVSHFTTPFGEVGIGICYDIRFAEYAMLLKQKYNCTILVYPGAFNMTTGPAHWELLQRARAIDNQCYVVTASPARSYNEASATTTSSSTSSSSSSSSSNDTDHHNEEEEEDFKSSTKYPHYTAWGHSTVVSPWGDVVATTDEREGIVIADLDLTKVEEVRKGIPIGRQKRSDLYLLQEGE
jgi:omega-amidase